MAIRVFINRRSDEIEKANITHVSSKRPGSILGANSRTDVILDLMDAVSVVPFLMASGAVTGRGTVGPGFDVVETRMGESGSQAKRKAILDFFNYTNVDQQNIKDAYGPLAKLYTTAFSFRTFGHAAWEIVRSRETGNPIGFDLIPGVIRPNVEPDGRFKRPAYTQYLRIKNVQTTTDINDPANVIFFAVPDFGANIYMADHVSLAEYTLPSEIYAAIAYKSLHENRDAPYSGFWYTPANIDDETFKRFVSMVNAKYTGAASFGKNPIIMKGEGGFKPLSIAHEDAPYIEGRTLNRHEISAVAGVPSAKYGGEDASSANIKELRREFYESTLRPMMSLMEEIVYRQVCIRLFDAPEWSFRFKRPDFTTAVEDASIELRRIQWGQWSPNEARASRGEPPREGGDYYMFPRNMEMVGPDGKPGRPDNDPVDNDEGDMLPGEEDTVPGTEPPVVVDDDGQKMLVDDLRKWKRFAMRVVTGKRYEREFQSEVIPRPLYDFIKDIIDDTGDDPEAISELFDEVLGLVEERWIFE